MTTETEDCIVNSWKSETLEAARLYMLEALVHAIQENTEAVKELRRATEAINK